MRRAAITFMVFSVLIFISCSRMKKNDTYGCEDMAKEIKGFMENCQSCRADDECFVDKELSGYCPFGCWYIRSHSYDNSEKIKSIQRKMEAYIDNCGQCKYDCAMYPAQNEIGCKKGKCVDLRYFSEKNKL